jgi:hypothetical protein
LNPFSNIGGAVLQLDAIRFAVGQERHGFSLYKGDVCQIQGQTAIGLLQREQPLQLSDIIELDSAAEGEDDLSVPRSFDLQHRFSMSLSTLRGWEQLGHQSQTIEKAMVDCFEVSRSSRIREIFAKQLEILGGMDSAAEVLEAELIDSQRSNF